MGILEQAMDFYRGEKGIYQVHAMDDCQINGILSIENDIRTQSNNEYVNIGCKEVSIKQHRFCAFYTDDFIKDFRTRLILMTSDGTVLGQSVWDGEDVDFSNEETLWVSEDFVMFPERKGRGEEKFLLYPFPCPELDEAIGCEGAIGASPTVVSDTYLKGIWGVPCKNRIFSMIIGFDE